MDSSVAFDPSTAKPVSFDPKTARQQKGELQGVGPEGRPDLISSRAQTLKEMITGNGVSSHDAFQAQADIEKRLRGEGKTDEEIQNDPEWQASAKQLNRSFMSDQYSTALSSPLAGSMTGKLAKPLATVAARVLPGATKRAVSSVTKIAPTFDKDKIGQDVLKTLRPDYDALHATRAAALSKVAQMDDGPAKTAAFRKVYQDPRFSELRKIEENPLGRKVTATTTQYSSVPKLNPKTFINQAFQSPQDVRDLKALYNGDQTKVEQVAARYVSSELKDVMETATASSKTEMNPLKSEAGNISAALARWRVQNADWLKEVPATKHVVDDFIDNMTAVAKTQKSMKIATVAGVALGLFDEGFHPWSWVKGLMGGVE